MGRQAPAAPASAHHHRDLVGVVLRDEQPGTRRVEGHPQGVAVQWDPLDQSTTGLGGDVDDVDLTISVG
jgi:hypothetical protein